MLLLLFYIDFILTFYWFYIKFIIIIQEKFSQFAKYENYNLEYQEKVVSLLAKLSLSPKMNICYHCLAKAQQKCKKCDEIFYYCSNDHEQKEWY